MKKLFANFIFTLLVIFQVQADELLVAHNRVEALFNEVLSDDNVHNASWAILSPSKKIDWSFAAGQFSSGEKVSDANPFYIASIGKTFTATAIAMLYEQGHLKLDDIIAEHLPQETLRGLHLYEGKDYSNEITIEHLLQHTSGLPDYFEDETTDDSPNGMTLLFADTEKHWAPEALIALSKTSMKPHFKPGTAYRYSDTGYVLLGLIVEHVSGLHLHEFFAQHIFVPLKMKNTYMHLRQQPGLATKKMAELFADNMELSGFQSLSLDWAGGGLASTARDLNKFQTALHGHQLLTPETLSKMKQWVPESRGLYYGFGLRKVDVGERFSLAIDYRLIGHTGSTSSFMFFCPDLDIYLSGTFNQINKVRKSIEIPFEILTYLEKATKNED